MLSDTRNRGSSLKFEFVFQVVHVDMVTAIAPEAGEKPLQGKGDKLSSCGPSKGWC